MTQHLNDQKSTLNNPQTNQFNRQDRVSGVSRRHIGKIIIIATAIVLLLVGGAIFAHTQGYITIPFFPATKNANEILHEALINLTNEPNGKYTVTFQVRPEEQTINTNSLQLSQNINWTENLLESIPSDFNLNGSLSIHMGQQTEKETPTANGIITLNMEYSGNDDVIHTIDAELRMKDGKTYILLQNIPSIPFIDLTTIKGRWIVADQTTAQDSLSSIGDTMTNQSLSLNTAVDFRNELSHMLRIALDQGVIKTVFDGDELLNGVSTQRIRISVHPEQFEEFIKAYQIDAQQRGVATDDANSALTSVRDPNFIAQAQEVLKNITITVWIDKARELPRKFSVDIISLPPSQSEKLKNKQVHVTLSITMDQFSEEPNVIVPQDTIRFEEILESLGLSFFGGLDDLSANTDMNISLLKNLGENDSAISNIRFSLTRYHEANSSYPSALNELLNEPPPPAQSGITTYFLPSLEAIPIDSFTGVPFEYSSNGDNYSLIYTMELANEETTNGIPGLLTYYQLQYVDGRNTATADQLSLEYASSADRDGDGLTDEVEKIFGTNPSIADTDGDGYSDGQEVQNGYDPLDPA